MENVLRLSVEHGQYDYMLFKSVQDIIRPDIKYIKQAETSLQEKKRSDRFREAIQIALEITNEQTKKETLLPRMAEILRMFGIDPEPYGDAGKTDFSFKPRGR